jgi:hypothetical protein
VSVTDGRAQPLEVVTGADMDANPRRSLGGWIAHKVTALMAACARYALVATDADVDA